jgi:hypothetical protein
MGKQMRKIILVLLLGAVFLPAVNVGAIPYQEATITGFDQGGTGNETVRLDFTIGVFDKGEWNGANNVTVADNQWIYTYRIYSAITSSITVNNLTLSELSLGFVDAGVIGSNTTVNTIPAPDGVANWVFTFKNGGDGLGPGETSDLLYVISSLNPYLSETQLRSAPAEIFEGNTNTYGTTLLPAPGQWTFDIHASVNPVPEPATLLLVGSALLIGAGSKAVRRRKRM